MWFRAPIYAKIQSRNEKLLSFHRRSGHHGLKTIEQDFPIFLLCGCIFEQTYFQKEFTPALNKLKEKYFGTKEVISHSRDIRKWQKQFKVLGDLKLRNSFYKDLDNFIAQAKFTVIASAILKKELIKQYGPRADNPYNLCLAFILERVIFYTDTVGCQSIKVIAEARGKKEDAGLQNQYQLVLSNGTEFVTSKRFQNKFIEIDFVKKEKNNLGTQLCDLVAYPVATKILYPKRENLAFRVVEPKIYQQFPDGDYLGYGLKIFP